MTRMASLTDTTFYPTLFFYIYRKYSYTYNTFKTLIIKRFLLCILTYIICIHIQYPYIYTHTRNKDHAPIFTIYTHTKHKHFLIFTRKYTRLSRFCYSSCVVPCEKIAASTSLNILFASCTHTHTRLILLYKINIHVSS